MILNSYEPFYNYSKTSHMVEFRTRLEATIDSLYNDLLSLDPLQLNISEYNQYYLKSIVQNLRSKLAVYADIFGSATCLSKKPLDEMVFIEYGGGTGFLSLIAKRMGVDTVIYNDIYDTSCVDAKEIASVLGCQAEYYVPGDIDSLTKFCAENRITGDAICSYDVIEHIYDIDDFCKKLHLIASRDATMMHASGGSMFFYPIVKNLEKQHIDFETKNRDAYWGHKNRDCLLAYSKIRENIICEYYPSLSENELNEMVICTRGFNQSDILESVDRYLKSGKFPTPIEHPTNTCDPYTGNWNEHLMNPYYLQETLSFNGFETKVLARYWYRRSNALENIIFRTANSVIRMAGSFTGLHCCPYIALYSSYTGEFKNEVHKQHLYRHRRSFIWYIMMVSWAAYSRLYQTQHPQGYS